jgi:hypothetical protein
MTSTQRVELEIDLLEKKRQALDSDLDYKARQHNDSMPTEEGMADASVALLILTGLKRDRDRLDAEIAEKKLALYDLQGGFTGAKARRSTGPGRPTTR